MAKRTADAIVERLRSLADAPDDQRALAVELVASDRRPSVFLPALTILDLPMDEQERGAMLSLYHWLDEAGVTRDLNASTRIRILKSLRSAELHAPLDLLLRAVRTVERAPGGLDEAAGLRAAALISLLDVEQELAGYHAARLLTDAETSPFSGEPAVTAVTVLATLDQRPPLYAYTMQTPQGQTEVLAEILNAMVEAPDPIVHDVVQHLLIFDDEPVVASVYELVLKRDDATWTAMLTSFLASEQRPHLLRYVATTIAAERRPWQIELLRQAAATEQPQKRRALLTDALDLLEPAR
ncbi:MAG: hypothetical protein KF883_00610 [Thermomicrobiales bacterium]|nr:hypothetical protein [Thermomicrobiales bacterium]